jgi:hypothetical protein
MTPQGISCLINELAASGSCTEYVCVLRARLSDDDLGTPADDEVVEFIESVVIGALELMGPTARWDGHEFGGGWAVIYCYAHDAVALSKCISAAILKLELKRDIQLYDESSRQIVTLASCTRSH